MMVMPSGPPQFGAGAGCDDQRDAGEQRRQVSSSEWGESGRSRPRRWPPPRTIRAARSASSAKSTIMMPFFLTMPIKQDDADKGDERSAACW